MTDFSNTPIRDENGKIIKMADGSMILFKHFDNDLPDESEEIFSNMSAADQLKELEGSGIPIPQRMIDRAAAEAKQKKEKKK